MQQVTSENLKKLLIHATYLKGNGRTRAEVERGLLTYAQMHFPQLAHDFDPGSVADIAFSNFELAPLRELEVGLFVLVPEAKRLFYGQNRQVQIPLNEKETLFLEQAFRFHARNLLPYPSLEFMDRLNESLVGEESVAENIRDWCFSTDKGTPHPLYGGAKRPGLVKVRRSKGCWRVYLDPHWVPCLEFLESST